MTTKKKTKKTKKTKPPPKLNKYRVRMRVTRLGDVTVFGESTTDARALADCGDFEEGLDFETCSEIVDWTVMKEPELDSD